MSASKKDIRNICSPLTPQKTVRASKWLISAGCGRLYRSIGQGDAHRKDATAGLFDCRSAERGQPIKRLPYTDVIRRTNDTPGAREVFARFRVDDVETTYTVGTASGGGKRVGELIVRSK